MSLVKKVDKKHNFVAMFDTETGFYVRTGILKNGVDTGVDPFMASYPELIDVGIMGHCIHHEVCKMVGTGCYQGEQKGRNMSLENFKSIIDQSKGKTFQVALGGKGDVNKHEDFEAIVKYCRENNVAPNYTTSGLGLTHDEVRITKENCGAVAVSWYRQNHTYRAIEMFVNAGVTTNIHYVLGKDTIDEATERLKNNDFPKGVNAVVFLLYKPIGFGSQLNVLQSNDPKVKAFYELVDTMDFDFKVGFDSCNMPGITNFSKNVDMASTDACEAGRFSCYITPDFKLLPCSFDNQKEKWAVDLNKNSIQKAWDSKPFEEFRNHLRFSCKSCDQREYCMGGCPIVNEITLCERPERNTVHLPYQY